MTRNLLTAPAPLPRACTDSPWPQGVVAKERATREQLRDVDGIYQVTKATRTQCDAVISPLGDDKEIIEENAYFELSAHELEVVLRPCRDHGCRESQDDRRRIMPLATADRGFVTRPMGGASIRSESQQRCAVSEEGDYLELLNDGVRIESWVAEEITSLAACNTTTVHWDNLSCFCRPNVVIAKRIGIK